MKLRSEKYHIGRIIINLITFQVACLRSLTKEDIISFFTTSIASPKSRKKLSCHVLSVCEGGAGHPAGTAAEHGADMSTVAENNETSCSDGESIIQITDVTKFKSSLPLFPLVQPFVDREVLKRPGSNSEE